ncbi:MULTISPECIES: hypothetical protein [Streptomyces]|uniref:C1q domain-containing protein n=1 Tax=Streptomyces doudnae TaxID=3075536 RepID=A0ABD5ENG1_9ACTN|nr:MULTISPECIES: hypothetical protein [unclassified Streptomyces]MDT0435599.1 hypothetical protein [Streptomyces sp. DSM 41981]MYQ62554.1 hypothetical protein [Streptomyces sp. SID4950]SCD39864.1 hypothetical protein GA0115242_104858 [Streptomyces sp. SolWspMP-5a-2]
MPRTPPVIASQQPGNYLTGALWNASVKAMGDWCLGSGTNGAPRFRGYATVAQALSNDTWTPLTLDSEFFDSDNGHSTTTNTSRFVVPVAGTWDVTGSVGFAANGTANRAVRITVNGAAVTGSFVKTSSATAAGSCGLVTVCQVVCAVNDYIEVQGNQNSGGALNTNAGSDVCSSLGCFWFSG